MSAIRRVLLAALWVCICQLIPSVDATAGPAPDELRFSRTRGFFDTPTKIELIPKTAGASIFYTTNGAKPTERSGSRYVAPLKINTTTILRTAILRDGKELAASGTQSYLFLKNVVKQTGKNFPPSWGTNLNKSVPADYEMDPEIVTHAAYRQEILPALKSIPTLSVVMDPADLFGAAHGIYAHPRESGADWERPASVELLYPDGRAGFQVDCGIRIQGGWNRRPEESPKHSFRLVFKKKYGPGKLKFPLFGAEGTGAGAAEFDTLIVNFYGANADWDHASNWYAARRRTPPGRFQFFIWDGERTLENPGDNSMAFDDDQSPPRLFQKLRVNARFRRLFAEQARKHLAEGGALSDTKASKRFGELAKSIESAVVAESARWGDYRRDVHPYKTGPYELYTRDTHWRPEIDRLLTTYFPQRTAIVIKQFREAGLYER